MTIKPFRPPTFKKKDSIPQYAATSNSKRLKLSLTKELEPSIATQPTIQDRRPLSPILNPHGSPTSDDESYYSVVWRKITAKKNKTWEEDGVLVHQNGVATIYNTKGVKLGSTIKEPLHIEDLLKIAGKEIQVEAAISQEEFGRTVIKEIPKSCVKEANQVNSAAQPKLSLQDQMRHQIQKKRSTAFKNPLKDSSVLPQIPSEIPIPRHDPTAPSALVFKRPKRIPSGKQVVDVVLDPFLTKNLRPHQRQGVKFLYECVMGHRDFGGQGCVLADDMGLGKTLQSIALIWTLLKQNPIHKEPPVARKVLIVCPVTLTMNWKREFRKWLGRDRVGIMCYGDEGSRLSMFDGRSFQVMIVGYERLTKIAEDLNKGSPIDLVICDEGHRLKTLQNKTAKAIETLNTPRRIILSGTPIQNDLSELFAMVNFVNDGVLGSAKAFVKNFERPILKSRQPNATEDDIEKGQDASDELAQTTSQFILRRTAQVLSSHLPLKTEYVLFCQPTNEQAQIYRQVLQTPMFSSAMHGASNENALQMITILKRLCNSPLLLKPSAADEPTATTSLTTLSEMVPRGLSRFYHNAYAAKIRVLDRLLQEIKNHTDDKIVLVSNYTSTLDLMQNLVSSSGMKFRRLDGTVSAKKRLALVDEFNKLPQKACHVFLLSAKAGGVGINLIGANRLILFDVDWNPAIEDQAMARIHRDGQKKQCYIYRLLIKGSIEERIWQRQVVKRGLADSIMEADSTIMKGKQGVFSAEELRDLFRLDENEGLRTHDLIGCSCQNTHPSAAADVNDTQKDESSLKTLTFTPASQLSDGDLEEQEATIRRGSSPRKAKHQSKEHQELLTYNHVDTSNLSKLSVEEREQVHCDLDDMCLSNVLLQHAEAELPGNVSFVFSKKTKTSDSDTQVVEEEPISRS